MTAISCHHLLLGAYIPECPSTTQVMLKVNFKWSVGNIDMDTIHWYDTRQWHNNPQKIGHKTRHDTTIYKNDHKECIFTYAHRHVCTSKIQTSNNIIICDYIYAKNLINIHLNIIICDYIRSS